jgi:Flp pilus assembly protein TadG
MGEYRLDNGKVPMTRKKPAEQGATLVEFALILPLLLTLLLGIVEFGWMFGRNVDVGHATREGVRLAAVNFPEYDSPSGANTTTALLDEICAQVSLSSSVVVSVSGSGDRGDPVEVTITAPGTSLTGFLSWAFPDDLELTATSASRIEQPASWVTTVDHAC